MDSYNELINKTNSSEFKIKFDKTKPLTNQLILHDGNFYLLNVSKTFINNSYIGVTFFYLTDEKKVHKQFLDKLRYPEELVNSKQKFLSNRRFKKFVEEKNTAIEDKVDTYTIPFKLDLGGEVIAGEKVYANNTYAFSNFYFSNNIICKGVYGYGHKKKFHKQNKLLEPTDNDLIKYAKEMKYTALQNVYTYVKTEYSTIEIIM